MRCVRYNSCVERWAGHVECLCLYYTEDIFFSATYEGHKLDTKRETRGFRGAFRREIEDKTTMQLVYEISYIPVQLHLVPGMIYHVPGIPHPTILSQD